MSFHSQVALVVLLPAAAALVTRWALTWWRYRDGRVVICPESGRQAGIQIAAGRVATRSVMERTQLEIATCSHWAEKATCGQGCLDQVSNAPEECRVRNIIAGWYAGKDCISCGRPFGRISLSGAKPAVLYADRVSVEWNQIPADRLSETLAAASPICFACHIASTLVRTQPELVVERHRLADHFRD